MDHRRRLAADPPERSATARIGPHLLGRVYRPDPRDWSLTRLMETVGPRRPTRGADTTPAWTLTTQFDQGQTPHCVGFGWAGWVDAAPVEGTYRNVDGHALYYECKVVDGEPGAENGSTVRSGALAVRGRGRLEGFAFATDTTEIDHWIDTQGPVVIGTDWTVDMFHPDAEGYVRPTGTLAGGHCYLLLDRLDDEDAYLFQNSWGPDWGTGGRFRMTRPDLSGLLGERGEACCALELPH